MKEQNVEEEKSQGKSVVWFECLYRLLKSFNFCQKLTIGNLLKMIKYKITG